MLNAFVSFCFKCPGWFIFSVFFIFTLNPFCYVTKGVELDLLLVILVPNQLDAAMDKAFSIECNFFHADACFTFDKSLGEAGQPRL